MDGIKYLFAGAGGDASGKSVSVKEIMRIREKIAISRGTDDNGMFAHSFSDEHYLPFEGNGKSISGIDLSGKDKSCGLFVFL